MQQPPTPFAPDSPLVAKVAPSPNHGERRLYAAADSVILHYTGMPTAQGALDWLCNPASQVSCHYFVFEDGRIVQLVPEARRAWHAGASFWRGETDMNSASIGVEIANPGHPAGCPPFPQSQIDATLGLVADLCARLKIAPERVLAHSDIAPGRKIDPGEVFPWDAFEKRGLARQTPCVKTGDGLAMALGATGAPVRALRADLATIGYSCAAGDTFDENVKAVVEAFQRRHRRARVDGVADMQTCALASLLAEAFA